MRLWRAGKSTCTPVCDYVHLVHVHVVHVPYVIIIIVRY